MNSPKKSLSVEHSIPAAMTPTRRPARDGERPVFSACPDSSGGRGGAYEYWKQVGSRYVSTDNAYTAAESRW